MRGFFKPNYIDASPTTVDNVQNHPTPWIQRKSTIMSNETVALKNKAEHVRTFSNSQMLLLLPSQGNREKKGFLYLKPNTIKAKNNLKVWNLQHTLFLLM